MSLDYNATVIHRQEIAPGLIILRVTPDVLPFHFEPGQYTVLGLKRSAPMVPEAEPEPPTEGGEDKLIRRAYSIASSSREDEYLEFYLTFVTSGELSARLLALQEGDRLYVGPKATGAFTLDKVPPDRDVLLVATGTGVAPYMSMLRTRLDFVGPQRFIVLHGARFSWDLGYRAELTAMSRQYPNLVYLPVITRPHEDSTWQGLTGYLQDVLFSGVIEAQTGIPLDPAHVHVFLCGNPGMIVAAKERLMQHGFVPDVKKVIGTIHTEEYW